MSADTLTLPETPPLDLPPVVDEPGKKPTTRAGRAARSAAAAAKRADAPPKATPAKKPSGKNPVADGVNGLHQLVGGVALPWFAQMPATGQALVECGPDAAEVWTALSKRYPAIEKMFTTSGDAALFVSLIMVYSKVAMIAVAESKQDKTERGTPLDLGMAGAMLEMLVPGQAPAPAAEQTAA